MTTQNQPIETNNRRMQRFRQGLQKTSSQIAKGFGALLLGTKEADENLSDRLKTALLIADLGVESTEKIIAETVKKTKRGSLNDIRALAQSLSLVLTELLQPAERVLTPDPSKAPFVIFFVGVNGAGKTTTIGKLGHLLTHQGLSVLLAAGDTFRAAASEQLQVWGERIKAPVISQQYGADAAAVIFDAMQAAQSRNIDIVLADTAGRLHNKERLMAELQKIDRVAGKLGNDAPHEVLLILDATTGRNGLQQVLEFQAAIKVSGLVITKLDGTAKGGFVVEVAQQTGLPVYYIGIGEKIDDLQPFSAAIFVDALLIDLLKVT